jgi:hypothetical protein
MAVTGGLVDSMSAAWAACAVAIPIVLTVTLLKR